MLRDPKEQDEEAILYYTDESDHRILEQGASAVKAYADSHALWCAQAVRPKPLVAGMALIIMN